MKIERMAAVVTGAASGIGRGVARELAARGVSVALADIELDRARELADELAAAGVESIAVECDVTSRESLEALAERAFAELGQVRLLCNNAGVGTMGAVAELPEDNARWVFDVNVFGVLNGCAAFVPRFKQQGGPAHVVNTGSEHSLGIPFAGMGIYTASKHAVLALSDVMRRELVDDGIGVSILCPGLVATDIWNAGRNRQQAYGGAEQSPAEFAELFTEGMDPDEVGRLVVAAVERDDFFILSHPEVRAIVEQRYDEMLAAFDAC